MSTLIRTIVVILFIELVTVALVRSSIPYTTDRIVEINKLHKVGIEQCKNSEGVSAIRYNTIFHHKIYCNDYTTIKYTSEL